MKRALSLCAVIVIAPLLLDNATAAATVIDRVRNGSIDDYVTFQVQIGVTDAALTALKVQESDDNATWTDIPETVFGAAGKPALPTANDDGKLYTIHLNCLKRKRYLKLVATAADGAQGVNIAALAILSQPHTDYSTAELRGATGAEIIV